VLPKDCDVDTQRVSYGNVQLHLLTWKKSWWMESELRFSEHTNIAELNA